MTLFWMCILAYLLVGAALGALRIYMGFYREGYDFTTSDLAPVVAVLFAWPLLIVIGVADIIHEFFAKRDGVIIPGSKSVKVEKALRK